MVFLGLFIFEIILLYILSRKTMSKIYRKVNFYIFAILFLPGTFIHEISHFLVALFLLVPVGQIDLMPQKEERELKLGSVPIAKTDPIRRTLIGIAPIFFGLLILLGSIFYVYKNNLYTLPVILLIIYLSFEIGNTMFSSKKDLEGWWQFLLIVTVIFVILYYLGLRLSIDPNIQIFRMADIFLSVPIGVDVFINLILKV